uniref:Ribonuclease H-like domain-containing protein n=1 Tax=Tanacetum cinerariifolium TaxID=118510 RepID=A0A6L2LK89_TANCI|nr:ribonuclease H-like domain-containing protein [Tanacetum cinerariifolium]
MVTAAKLPVLNPNEFKLWKIRIEQSVDGVETPYPPTIVEEKLARKNELKDRGTLLMALPNEHQLKFNSYKTAKSLMETIEKRFGGNKESKKVQKTLLKQQYKNFNGTSSEGLDQIYDKLQKLIRQLEIHGETISQEDLNLKLLKINIAYGVSAASSKTNASNLPNVDSLSDAVIYSFVASQSNSSQLGNEDLKQIDPDDLEEMDLKWQIAMWNAIIATEECDGLGYDWSDQAKDGPTNFALVAYASLSYSSSDSKVSSCSKACLKSYETLKEHYDNITKDFNKSQFNLGAYKAGLESVEARLEVYKKNEAVFEDEIKILKLDVMFKDKAITELRQKFEKVKKERDDLKLTLEKFEGSSKNLSRLLDSQQYDKFKTGLGNFMPSKPDLVFADEHVVSESVTSLPSIAKIKVKTSESKPKTVSAPIIEDWVSDSDDENEIETETKQIKPSFAKVKFVKPTEHVKSPRKSIKQEEILTNSGLKILNTGMEISSRAAVSVNTARPINTDYQRSTVNGARPASNVFNKAHSHGNPQQELQEKEVIDSGCSRHMTGNMSYLSEYEEIDGGYVAFGGDPKGRKITSKGKISTGKLDFEDTLNVLFCLLTLSYLMKVKFLLRVLRKKNMYIVDLRNVASSGGLTCLFAKATLDVSNLWHMRLGHMNFKTMNKLVKGNLVRGLPSKIFENDHICVACQKGKQHKASCKTKTIRMTIVDLVGQNGVAERKNRTLIEAVRTMLADSKLPSTFWAEAVNTACYVQNRVVIKPHNKISYELFLGRKPSLRFMRLFGCPVTILNTLDHLGIGPNWMFDIDSLTMSMNYQPVFTGNQTNGNAGPKSSDDKDADKEMKFLNINTVGSNDPSMPSLEETGIFDDVYDDREVGAEADTNNLELLTVVSPIFTTRVHKDHSKKQIIGDLNLATQTKRMIIFSEENAMGHWNQMGFKNKKDERGIVVRNKARLVAQGYPQEEGIDYDEVFAPIARIEETGLFLAYASFMGFIMYQMDVKSALLYGTIKEEVHVSQPPGFEDPHFPDKVYKDRGDILLVQVYVDDIIFGSTKKLLCDEFEQMMHKRFQMSSIGELTFFLRLQVKQKDDEIFFSQDKYVADILKKFDFTTVKTTSTPIETNKALLKDEDA